jgi:hypothetical protein
VVVVVIKDLSKVEAAKLLAKIMYDVYLTVVEKFTQGRGGETSSKNYVV